MEKESNMAIQKIKFMKVNFKKDSNLVMEFNLMIKVSAFLRGTLLIINTIKSYNYWKQLNILISKW